MFNVEDEVRVSGWATRDQRPEVLRLYSHLLIRVFPQNFGQGAQWSFDPRRRA